MYVRSALETENGRCWQLVEVGVIEDDQTEYGDQGNYMTVR